LSINVQKRIVLPESQCYAQPMSNRADLFPLPAHHHGDCIRAALDAAERKCREQSARLTTVRRRVLELVWHSHEPVGAYALLDQLKQDGHSAAPPTVYRALEFLMEHGLIHRLERRNAFVGCAYPGDTHSAKFLICTLCGRAVELEEPAIDAALLEGAAKRGFLITRQTVEVEGHCPDCQSEGVQF